MNKGQNLYKRAKAIIPGGTMLLSKRPEMFLPEKWPAYFSKAKGCHVWDLDGNKYIDMSIMGIGTNTLGYGHPKVDEAVLKTIQNGNMSTLNCPEEVYLAEELIQMNPWANMVRFARTGGEANAMSIRIARAATGKDKVAICGYHGWHDWYLSTNHNQSEDLTNHLLPGLEPAGVPKVLKNSVFPFNYNDINKLEEIIKNEDIGVIKMEVTRNYGPENSFLQKVRKLSTDNNIVLIFDECTSGFRETYGGIHQKYGVDPDMIMFGKTLGNGYAITAVVGRHEVMSHAQRSFISSTFWTERIGPTAGLKTLEVMRETESWKRITEIGDYMRKGWQSIASKNDVKIQISGIPALSTYSFESSRNAEYKTFVTQEMLKIKILASTNFYPCIEHKVSDIEIYLDHLDRIFNKIGICEKGSLDINELLESPVCHLGFKRLN